MKRLILTILCAGFLLTSGDSQASDVARHASTLTHLINSSPSLVPADTGFNNDVRAIGIFNGDLIVGGNFSTADGFTAIKVAGWNGTGWYQMNGFPNGNPIYWLHVHDSLLYAGQALTQLNSWDGTGWTGHVPWLGNTFGNIWGLETYNNQLYVGGGFDGNANEPSYIAIWNGAGWDSVGTSITNDVRVLHTWDNKLIAGGHFTTSGGSVGNRIASWNETTWSPLGTGINGGVFALTTFNSQLIAGGVFDTAGGVAVNNIARWNGSVWQPLGGGLDGWVQALLVHNNKLIVGGRFLNADGSPAAYIASWDGSAWAPIGNGFDDDVYALGEYNGYLIAGGAFSDAGGYVALWDGATWRPVSDIVTDVDDIDGPQLPGSFSLDQNYPNPFNAATQIQFDLPRAGRVQIDIYNILGHKIRSLVNERLSAGRKSVTWDASNASSGVYFYRIVTSDYVDTKRMLLLK